MSTITQSPLYKIACPESIAFFGASNNFSAMGSSILNAILGDGYEGRIFPVHPEEKRVMDIEAYPRVGDLPRVPDMAYIVLPTRIVAETLRACGQKGIRRAVIVTAGFSEVGTEGMARQEEIKAIARKYHIRFTGPNCIGVVNAHMKLNATFIPSTCRPGFIGMASQSGSFITQMFDYLGTRFGRGFSTGFSLGNEADIDMVDCIRYLGACPNTRAIALYIESIRRGRAFIEAAREVSRTKPIVAFYVGGSENGKKACLSHTGSLAGPDRLYDGVFKQSGIIRARSVEEMFDFCYALGACPVPKGNRAVIQTHSGGPGAAAADACDRSGIELPALSTVTLEKLGPYVPHTGSVNNPVDLTYTKNPLDFFQAIPRILLEEEGADSMLVYFLASAAMIRRALAGLSVPEEEIDDQVLKIVDEQCASMAALMTSHDKPVLGFSFLTRENQFISGLQDKGVPVLPSPERAARALGALVEYRRLREKLFRSKRNDFVS
ncbi:acetyl-CoA synthetase [Desulfosarcina alkanivorans]|uniref:Acetyl-CoA synthetase n=1 Tax=Desulfosarcina alkanivorans TaxID=571177 RepID=A0A5K7YQN0_9BACT|nr:CoA-binding protein [Desulfosarcina alkanivorans]BBO70670.1 acetyl-CoA synthetase [Desulfosarcina alkanivorans]